MPEPMTARARKFRRRSPEAGRKILCNRCLHLTVKGAAQVYRKLLFFFCPDCWFGKREDCNRLMQAAGDRHE